MTKCNVHIVVTPIIVRVLKLLIIMCSCMYYSETCLLRSCFFTNKKWNILSLKWLFCFIFQLFLHSNDLTSSPSYYNVCISNTLPHTDLDLDLDFFFFTKFVQYKWIIQSWQEDRTEYTPNSIDIAPCLPSEIKKKTRMVKGKLYVYFALSIRNHSN